MQQTKHISEVVTDIQATNKSLPTCSTTLQLSTRAEAVKRKFLSEENFMLTVNPDTQSAFARKAEISVMGDYPTLTDINAAYGNNMAQKWLMPQLADLSLYTGAKNLTQRQMLQLANIISTEYHYLKVTELLMFFHRFKAGAYGQFYGNVDPMVVTCALRTFIQERSDIIARCEQEQREKRKADEIKRNPPISREDWELIKPIAAMYNSEITI